MMKPKIAALCVAVAAVAAAADGDRPRLFLRPQLLPRLRERCARGDIAGRYGQLCRDARRAIGAELPPEPPVLPKTQPDRNREYTRAFRTVRPPTHLMQVCERDPARKARFVDQAHFRAATEPCVQAEIVTLLEVSRPGEQKQGAVATCTDTPEGTRVRVDCGGRHYDVLFPRGEAPVSTAMQ